MAECVDNLSDRIGFGITHRVRGVTTGLRPQRNADRNGSTILTKVSDCLPELTELVQKVWVRQRPAEIALLCDSLQRESPFRDGDHIINSDFRPPTLLQIALHRG